MSEGNAIYIWDKKMGTAEHYIRETRWLHSGTELARYCDEYIYYLLDR